MDINQETKVNLNQGSDTALLARAIFLPHLPLEKIVTIANALEKKLNEGALDPHFEINETNNKVFYSGGDLVKVLENLGNSWGAQEVRVVDYMLKSGILVRAPIPEYAGKYCTPVMLTRFKYHHELFPKEE